MTLAELKNGVSAQIEAVDCTQPGVLRLMVLGLVEGVPVSLRNVAIGGDPIEVSVHGASVSVRLEQARHIQLRALPANP